MGEGQFGPDACAGAVSFSGVSSLENSSGDPLGHFNNMSNSTPPVSHSITIPVYCNFIEYIGSGSYGDVSKCYSQQHNQVVAVKRVKMDSSYPSVPPTTLREIAILKKLNQSSSLGALQIVRLLDVSYDRQSLFLIFEYCDTDLERYLKNKRILPKAEQKSLFRQLLLGLQAIHGAECIHRDLKPNNLLIKLPQIKGENQPDNDSPLQNTAFPILKITDFGLARTYAIQGQTTANVASLWYRSPELLLGKTQYGPEIDMWSAGACFYKLLTGKTLFTCQSDTEMLEQLGRFWQNWPRENIYKQLWGDQHPGEPSCNLLLQTIEGIDADEAELLAGLLEADPARRWSATRALQSPWFDRE